jgi:hypothetical protein
VTNVILLPVAFCGEVQRYAIDIGVRISPCKVSKLRRLHGVKESCKIKMRIEKKKEGRGSPRFVLCEWFLVN